MNWLPRGYGGEHRSPEAVKREGWQKQGLLVVGPEDDRLSWPERELFRGLGEKPYGPRPTARRRASGRGRP